MAEIIFGHREGPGKGREYPVGKNVYFHRRGGHFVWIADGYASLCATAHPNVMGWAEVPKDTDGKSSWKSSSTKGTDKVFVITGLEDVFELPVNEGKATLAASYIGHGAALIVNTTTNATYAAVQQAKIGGGATASQLSIVDVDVTNKTVFVKIKPGEKQAG